jgi:hypothetical protein
MPMPAEPHPSKANLQRLTLRALLTSATRCACRVQPVLAEDRQLLEASEAGLDFAEALAHGAEFTTEQADQESGKAKLFGRSDQETVGRLPRNPLLDLENAMAASRFAAIAAANVCWAFHGPTTHAPCCESALDNAERAIAHAALVTGLTLADPLNDSIRAWFESTYPDSTQETYWARDAIWSDYWALVRLSPNRDYPQPTRELGDPIDPSEEGPLGTLWPCGEPTWYAERLQRMGKASPARLRHIQSGEEVSDLWDELLQPEQSAPVLSLTVGRAPGAFPDVAAAARWLKEFRGGAPASLRIPTLIVLAAPGSVTPELTLELGAVVVDPKSLDRTGLDPAAGDLAALARWVASFAAVRSRPATARSGAGRSLEPAPPEAAMFGRQPSHSDPFDEQEFRRTLKNLNEAPWWPLDE